MDTDSFTIFIIAEEIYVDIAEDVEIRFITEIMQLKDHYLDKKIKSISINEGWIRWKSNDRVCCLESKKTFSYLVDDDDQNKKAKAKKTKVP